MHSKYQNDNILLFQTIQPLFVFMKPNYTENFLSQLSYISTQARKGNPLHTISEPFHRLHEHWEKGNKIILQVLPIMITSQTNKNIIYILNEVENLEYRSL